MISTFIFLFLIAQGFSDVPCNDQYCIGCIDNICSVCINGYSLGVDRCEICSLGYYSDGLNCFTCDSGCKNCSSQNQCSKCMDLYYLDSNICHLCQFPCFTCNTLIDCDICRESYYLDQLERKCLPCDSICETCETYPKYCLSCKSGQYLENNTCLPCDTRCQTCTSLTSCQSCTLTNYLDGSLCNNCPPFCFQCESATKCTKCVNDSYLLTNNQCIPCSSPCGTCDEFGCKTCITTYYYDSTQTTEKCQTCISPCAECNSSTDCQRCIFGFYLNGSACMKCTNNCESCESEFICLSCESPKYILNVDKCDINCNQLELNCKTCNGLTRCLSCQDKYYLDLNSITTVCQPCSNNCNTCEEQANQCITCAGNRINTPWCNTCQNGYYDSGQQNCEQCNLNYCQTCTGSSTNCIICLETRINPPQCICKPGTYSKNDDCKVCIDNCQNCENSNQCQKCNQGFYYKTDQESNQCISTCGDSYYQDYSNQICLKCKIENCKICISNSDYGCTSCLSTISKDQKDIKGNVCTLQFCPLYLQQQSYCLIECLPGYYGKVDFVCQQCNENCSECKDSSTECTKCYSNFYLQQNQGQSVKGQCLSVCPIKFYPNVSVLGGICMSCHQTCQECTDNLPTSCKSCAFGLYLLNNTCVTDCGLNQGYYPNNYYNRCDMCPSNCVSCEKSQPYKCTSCDNSTYLYLTRCLQNCPLGYSAYENRICKKCDTSCLTCFGPLETNCQSCMNQYVYVKGINSCEAVCPEGYILNFNLQICENCIEGCQSCDNLMTCKQCKDQYFLNINANCVTKCPDGYYGEISSKLCKICAIQCLTCIGFRDTDCIICANSKIQYFGECISECPLETFLDVQNQKCEKCTDGCVICQDNTHCQTCYSEYKFYKSICYSRCPIGTYELDQICTECMPNCAVCYNSMSCHICNDLTFYTGQACLLVCPSSQYGDSITRTCQQCDQTCGSCFGSSYQNCLSCETNYLFNSQCTPFCPDGYFQNAINKKCEFCRYDCATCVNKASECTSCPLGTYLYGSSCLSICPNSKYQERSSMTCEPCSSGCKSCFGPLPDQCTFCSLNSYYNLSCLTSCPKGTFRISNSGQYICEKCHWKCSQCVDSSEICQLCVENTYNSGLVYGGKCSDVIPDEYYVEIKTQKFKKCQFTGCRTCIEPYYGTNKGSCTSCWNINYTGQTFNYYLLQNSCFTKCQTRIISGVSVQFYGDQTNPLSFVCVINCPNHTFKDLAQALCEKCHDTCLTCSSTRSDQCLSCSAGIFLENGVCQENCSQDYYPDQGLFKCFPCHSSCLTCDGPAATDCTQCHLDNYLNDGMCLTKCNNSYFSIDFVCNACHFTCLTCSGIQLSNCLICKIGYFFKKVSENDLNGQCVQNCENGYYANSSTNACEKCNSNCLTCSLGGINDCITCQNGFLLLEGSCTSACNDGYYKDGILCRRCDPTCKTCNNNTGCLSCIDQFYQESTSCLSNCSVGYADSKGIEECVKCVDQCQYCIYESSQTKCIKCKTNYFLSLIKDSNEIVINTSCTISCPDGKYKNYDYQICSYCHWTCSQCTQSSHLDCIKCGTIKNPQTSLYETRYMEDQLCQLSCSSGAFAQIDTINGNKCVPCDKTCQSCKGLTSLDCTSCFNSTYLLDNQCKQNCPIGYYGLHQQCQQCFTGCTNCSGGKFNQCIECKSGYYYYKNTCLKDNCPIQYYKQNQQCMKCNETCLQCTGPEENECLTCLQELTFYPEKKSCHKLCPEGSFFSSTTYNCQTCHTTCRTCSGALNTDCLTCQNQDGNIKYYFQNQCLEQCVTGSFGNPKTQKCQKCSIQCIECEISSDNCINTCAGNRVSPPSCNCPTGYLNNSTSATCSKCLEKCSSCEITPSNCVACVSNRSQNPPYCSCPQGYFDVDGTSECAICAWKCTLCQQQKDTCILCRGDRSTNQCVCLPGKYEDLNTQQEWCQDCGHTCSTCEGKPSYCTRCKSDRVSSLNPENSNYYSCECPQNYYEDVETLDCNLCEFKCVACTKSRSNCMTCRGDRLETPFCYCAEGYFDDEINDNCQKCDFTCKTCDKKGCLSCAANRIGPNAQNLCICPGSGSTKTQVAYCSTCSLGVPLIKFQDSLDSLSIILEGNLIIKNVIDPTIATNENCQYIFAHEDFIKLGNGIPLCQVDPKHSKQIIVYFGSEAYLKVGDQIILSTLGLIGRKDCQGIYFTDMKPAIINPPDQPIIGYVLFSGPQLIDLCSKIQFYPSQNFNDGGRGLTMKSWSIKSMKPEDPNVRSTLQYIFDESTQIKNNKIVIPELTLTEYSEYVFTYTFTNFIGQELSSDYLLKTTSFNRPSVNIEELSPHVYKTNVRITLKASIQHLNCQSGKIEIIEDSINYLWISKEKTGGQTNLLSKVDHIKGIKPPSAQIVQIIIPPYSGMSGLEYQVTLEATLADEQVSGSNSVDVRFIQQDLQVQINGGSRLNGFSVPLYLQSSAKDPNVETNQSKDITFNWKCLNLLTISPCTNMKNEEIKLNSTSQQAIPGKQFVPYNSYKFTLNATKGNIFKVDSVVIVIIEFDLPLLELSKPDYLSTERVNLNEEIKMKFVYPSFNPDNLYYGGAIVYDYNVVAILKFYYTSITLKIWDYFYEFQSSNQVIFKASVYDPHFFMPSTASIVINTNLPPRNCKLSISPYYGLSFNTTFQIKVTNCDQKNIPLSYKFSFYLSPNQYEEDILKAQSQNQNLLYDYLVDNTIHTILPYPNQDLVTIQPFIMLMVSVQDLTGGFTNLTSNVVIGRDEEDLQKQLRMAELIRKKQQISNQYDILKQIYQHRQLSELVVSINKFNEIYASMNNLSIENQISLLNILALGIVEINSEQIIEDNEQIQQEKSKVLTLKLNILAKLQYFQTYDVSAATKSQIIKSIALLMNDEEIIYNMTPETINYSLQYVNLTLNSNLNKIQEISQDIENEFIDFRLFQQKENLQNDIMRAAGQLDGLLSANQQKYELIISQGNTQNSTLQAIKENNYQLLKILEFIKAGFLQNVDPNYPPKYYIGNAYSLKSQLVTQGKLTENLGGINPFAAEKVIKISEEEEPTISPANHIIKFYQTEFRVNPYITDKTFPNRSVPSPIQFIEPRLSNGSVLVPRQPIPLNFNITPYLKNFRNLQTYQDLYSLDFSPFSQDFLCIGKSLNGEWSVGGGNCKSFLEIDTTGALYVTCKCEELTLTTVSDFLSDIIDTEKFSRAFTIEAVIALFSFPFYKSIIIYALLFMTAGLVFSVSYGFRQDLIDENYKALHCHFVESEFIRIAALERAKEKSKEKQRQYASHKNQSIDLEEHLESENREAEDYFQKVSEEEHIKNQFLLIQPDLDPEELIKLNESFQAHSARKTQKSEQKETINVETDIIQMSSQGNDLEPPQLQIKNQTQSIQPYEQLDQLPANEGKQDTKFVQIEKIEEIVDDNVEDQIEEKVQVQFKDQVMEQNQFQEDNQNSQACQNSVQNNTSPKQLYQSDQVIQHQSQYSDDVLFLSSCLRNHRDSFEKSPNQLGQKKVKFNLKQTQTRLLRSSQLIDSESSDEESEKSDPGYDIKEDKVIQWHRDQKKEKFIENQANLKFTLSNFLLFIRIFHPIFGIFARFERRQPRPIRFCVVYMTILNTCYINIYFQVPLEPFQSILYSMFSAAIQDIEILIIRYLMAQRFKLVRGIGWMIFSGASALFIYLIIITMAFEAAQKQDDVKRSNEWGLNFIIGFIFTNFVAVPLKLLLAFKALQLSVLNSTGVISQILINLFADPSTNEYFEVLQT